MKAWAEEELRYAELGDVRRKKRLIRIVSDLAAQPNVSVPQASGDLAATQAAYEFWQSPYIKPEAIALSHQKSTTERVKQQPMAIAIQDTTELNFTHHPAKRGMGYLDNAKASGLKVHPCGQLTLELRRHPEREARQATLTLRATTLELQPPATHPQRERLQPIRLQVIWAAEENPPTGVEQVRWLLLTTLTITCFEDVVQCLRWYSYRWLIERYHYVLKSGCRLEQLQLETADRIQRALATYTIVAWRLLWMTYLARYHPDTPADTVLETHEWQALYCTIHQTPKPPDSPPDLRTCVRWIAQLGGFLARKHDGEPGVKTLWQGLRRLHDIAQTWLLLSPFAATSVKSDLVKKDVTNA